MCFLSSSKLLERLLESKDCKKEARLHYNTKAESQGNKKELDRNSMSSEHRLAKRIICSLASYDKEKRKKELTTMERKRRRLQ